MRGAGSPLTATRVDGLEPCSIVDDGGTRFLKTSSAYPDPDPGFHPDPGYLWHPGAGTLSALSALRELLPRGGLVRGSVCRWRSSACSPWRCWLALRRTGPGAGSPEFPWPGFSPRQSWAWTSSGRCWSRISGTPGRRWWRRCSAGARSSWCGRPGRPRLRSGSAWRRCSGAGGACCSSRATGRACRRAYGSPRGGGADSATGTGGCGRASRR